MPKLKSVIAGLAVSTALTGGVVSLGATTTANASTAGETTLSWNTSDGHGWGHRRHRCGKRHGWGNWGGGGWGGWGWGPWGGGWRRHHRGGGVCVKIFNENTNDNT